MMKRTRSRSSEEEDSEDYDASQDLFASHPEQKSWRGVPLSEIETNLRFPPLCPNRNWTICVRLPISSSEKQCLPFPAPEKAVDKWDEHHVRMPFSRECLQPKYDPKTCQKELRLKWELIKTALEQTEIGSSQDLEDCILSYNRGGRWNFNGLKDFFEDEENFYVSDEESRHFFRNILPGIKSLVLNLPRTVTTPLRLLKRGHNHSLTLSQVQISSLLANAFFCTFPRRNAQGKKTEYSSFPDINFNRLFEPFSDSYQGEKLKCIFNYFRRRCSSSASDRLVTFTRRSLSYDKIPDWKNSTKSLPKLHIDAKGSIEDNGFGLLQVDFANAMVGGGVFGHGCVQEEIRFLICPELIISRLFTEKLAENECLIISGFERYSSYEGYSNSFKFSDSYVDTTPIHLETNHRKTTLVAIDAILFRDTNRQYSEDNIRRELLKVFVGFYHENDGLPVVGVATGNWGCGAFGGDPYLKSLIQLLAAAEAGRDVVYYTFGDEELRDSIFNMYSELRARNVTVGQLYDLICDYQSYGTADDLYEYLKSRIYSYDEKETENDVPESIPSNGKTVSNESEEAKEINSKDLAEMTEKKQEKDESGFKKCSSTTKTETLKQTKIDGYLSKE